ncbi:hypothetical protein BJ912DRAFT_229914 [Pholiota molesta]|nr:hypothetical protein BJ912DRAFT_229914 [Pholiota molesta]
MPSLGVCACVIWLIAAFITPSLAQTSGLFQWSFANTALSTSIPTCFSLSIIVESFNNTTNVTTGTPPYYMIAFAVGKTPVTTFIGTDEKNLNWTVTEPAGSQLVLSVVDANGSAGGIQPRMFTVNEGMNTQCVTTPTLTPAFTITSNVTGDLETCQPWGLTVNGGVPPYIVTLGALGSPVVTNVSMPLGDNMYTFINRAAPNRQLIGAVSDQTGRWATGTLIVNTKGSSDVSCAGLMSSSGNVTLVQQDADAANRALSAAKNAHSVAVGVAVAFMLIFLIALGIGGVIYLRRRQRQNQKFRATTMPSQFQAEVEAQLPSAPTDTSPPMYQLGYTAMGGTGVTQPSEIHYRTLPSPDNPPNTGLSYYPSGIALDRHIASTYDRSPASTRVSRAGFSRFPSLAIRRLPKSVEGEIHSAVSPDSEYVLETAISDSRNVLGMQLSAISSTRTGTMGRMFWAESRVEEEPGMTDQHQDARSINEPPPPYADGSESNWPTL